MTKARASRGPNREMTCKTRGAPGCQDELSKVLVLRKEHAPAFKRESHHLLIGRSAGDLGYGNDIVTLSAHRADNYEIATFVGQELQVERTSVARGSQHEFFLRHRVRGIRQGRSDSLAREMWVSVQHISLGGAFAELPHDQIHGDSSAADDGLAQHDAAPFLNNKVSVAAYLTDILNANDPALLAAALGDIDGPGA